VVTCGHVKIMMEMSNLIV